MVQSLVSMYRAHVFKVYKGGGGGGGRLWLLSGQHVKKYEGLYENLKPKNLCMYEYSCHVLHGKLEF